MDLLDQKEAVIRTLAAENKRLQERLDGQQAKADANERAVRAMARGDEHDPDDECFLAYLVSRYFVSRQHAREEQRILGQRISELERKNKLLRRKARELAQLARDMIATWKRI